MSEFLTLQSLGYNSLSAQCLMWGLRRDKDEGQMVVLMPGLGRETDGDLGLDSLVFTLFSISSSHCHLDMYKEPSI